MMRFVKSSNRSWVRKSTASPSWKRLLIPAMPWSRCTRISWPEWPACSTGGITWWIFGCLTCEEFGWLRGLFKLVLFIPFSHRQRKGELWIDSIVVCPSMRGKGVGTRLLQAVFELARAEGFGLVGLEVVDTNPGAHRLYERMGFVSTETHKLPYLRRVMGFSASTTMVKEIAGDVGKK